MCDIDLGRNYSKCSVTKTKGYLYELYFFPKNLGVSLAKERKEKDCLNCGTLVHGRYCHVCSQNGTPRNPFWHLVSHFFHDITHFDGKFFSTLRYLILKFGFLSQEYLARARMSYLNPGEDVCVYLRHFFLLFFSFSTRVTPPPSPAINGYDLAEIRKNGFAAFARFTSTLDRDDHTPNRPMTAGISAVSRFRRTG